MLETPHAVVGATIATQIPDPLVAIPLAFASHFVLDMVPHWNPHLNTEVNGRGAISGQTKVLISGDVLLALLLGSAIAFQFSTSTPHMFVILLGAFAGVLPDLVEAPHYFLNWKTKAIDHWIAFQKAIQVDTAPVPGLMTQLATIVAAFWWIAS